MIDIEAERAKFEAWCIANGVWRISLQRRINTGCYADQYTEIAWDAWQVRAKQQEPQP